MRALVVTLLIGWGAGWFVAQSRAFEPVRDALAGWCDATARRLDALAPWRGVAPRATLRHVILTGRLAVLATLGGAVGCAACIGFWIGCGLGTVLPVAGSGVVGALATGAAVMGVNAVLGEATHALSALGRAAWALRDQLDPGPNPEPNRG